MSGAKALIESLKREGVEVIFGFPGGAIMPVYDELLDSGIRHILVRHEQAAAHMADGYARVTGRVGVCMATSGPGSTNLVTGIATAHMDSSPIVAFTGQVARPFIGKDAFQEIDIIGITANIVKHNYQVRDTKKIPAIVKAAFHIASTSRKGPVLVDFPRDVQTEITEIEFTDTLDLPKKGPYENFSSSQVEEAVKLLLAAEKPIILAGGGVISSNACQELLALAEYLNVPVATTLMAKGCIPEDHPLALGMIGMHGTPYGNRALSEADLIFAVGCRFSDRSISGDINFNRQTRIIHVDIDASEISKNVDVTLALVGDAKEVLKKVLEKVKEKSEFKKSSEWFEYVEKLKKDYPLPSYSETDKFMKPQKLMKILREILPKNAIVATEVGQNQMWAAIYLKTYLPRTFITSGGLGTMGFGFPAALGAKVAKPDVPVVNIAGDGSFIMNEHELATSVEEKIPVTVIVLDNRVLGMVAQWQRIIYKKRYSQVHLGNSPDFVKLAEAYGAIGVRVQSYEEFEKAVKQAIKSDVTTVIDVLIHPEEDVEPIILPKGVLSHSVG
ncbi:MAG: biosynthetic-type acetolactate synthase large subunit [Candidatus Hecatellales archaeon]|nr:MAG: biosynthetic-type acetolactate synthase large subunit [Candidatus Hecatellales archaeon]